ncbi:hypothetical protein CH272_27990 [Rhodococcus sp. 05-340-1]|uniref:FAD binding domain-containing protein n=1 Tax=unclassified Rhodococcus (in: high G+C Gram-positive bacteria) TaxID=192944 RepID=UPI000B9BC1F2|nr:MULTISPECIES: FAD binding domain-containing protein [unclassified Rhodococcus (in: high G+C Gram-positive bacteria)]OZD68858.1 hypothetical protein CH271_10710 [Rhodococcus sp. 05-340-2]OZD69331.1 hypothetical protein CH272_27990 [Rhodococcus sp. 05-340-1]
MRTQSRGAGILSGTQTALAPFELHRPTSADEALQALHQVPTATILAGSTDLVAQFREGLAPREVIALGRMPDWREIVIDEDALRIGALTTHDTGPRNTVLRQQLPNFAAAWASIATVRIRSRATLGGNVMARQNRYEMPLMLASLGAELELVGFDGEYRATPADVWRGESPPEGFLHHVRIPVRDLLLFSYDRSMRPLLTVALAVRALGSGLQFTATVGSEYRRPATVRLDVDVADIVDVDAEQVGQALSARLPEDIGDYAASARYRKRVVAVLIRRQLSSAAGPSDSAGKGAL